MMYAAGLLAALVALFLADPQDAQAQPQLTFKRIVRNWPSIELYFTVGCNGQPSYFTDRNYFAVAENGVEISQFNLWCPDPLPRPSLSAALLLDASGNMSGSGNAAVKAAANGFVDTMDSTRDTSAVLWFSTATTVQQGMTSSKPLLRSAIDALPASGNAAVLDAVYAAILYVSSNSANQNRAVILMSAGQDAGSTRTAAEVVALANQNRVCVFTIGLGSPINRTPLEYLANMTGGRYYEGVPTANQLAQIYQKYAPDFPGFQECMITYTAACMDGGTRTVDLILRNTCGGADTATKSYTALRDTTTFSPLRLAIGNNIGRGNANIAVPLQLLDTLPAGTILYPAAFTILYDANCMQFSNIAAPPGSLLEGVPLRVTPTAGGMIVETLERKIVSVPQAPAMLAELTFKTGYYDGKDTVCCPVRLSNWTFSAGCHRPVLQQQDGEICILPGEPRVSCAISAPPSLSWVRSRKNYEPNPFIVRMTLSNTGDRAARNARFTIIVDTTVLSLTAPPSNTQMGTPRNVDTAGYSEALWSLTAKRQLTGDSVSICIRATFDNHPMVECCTKVWLEPSDPVLEFCITAPAITVDWATQKYDPMPFTVDGTVLNQGGRTTDSVYGTIIVPKDLQLYGPDAPDRNTKLLRPAILAPGQQGVLHWTLWHPISLDEKTYRIGVWVKTSNADSSYCMVEVVIPAMEWPILSPRDIVPDSLHFDENADEYDPNPFTVTLTCVNRGGLPASNVTGFIYLPANVELTDPKDSLRKTFNPSTLEYYKGGPMPTLTWNVRYTKRLRYDTYLDFRFVVGGVGPAGVPLDSVLVWSRVRVPGLKLSYSSWFRLPDSLALNAEGTDVEPNPFIVVFKVWNSSHISETIKRVDLNYPFGDDLYLDPSTPKTINPNQTLAPGDTLTTTWIMTAKNRITRRYVTIFAVAYDDEGNPIICSDGMPIANLMTSMTCSAAASDPVICYDPIARAYAPSTWSIAAELENTGGAALSNITAEIELADSSLAQYVMFDPNPNLDNTNPKLRLSLSPKQRTTFTWHFTVAAPNTSGVSVYPLFNIRYSMKEMPFPTSGCDVRVEIMPAVISGIDRPPLPDAQPELFPDPSAGDLTVRVPTRAGEIVRITVVDMLGRSILQAQDVSASSQYQSTLRLAPLVPGTYYLFITSGERRWARSLRLY